MSIRAASWDEGRGFTRRQFLAGGATLAAALGVGQLLPGRSYAAGHPAAPYKNVLGLVQVATKYGPVVGAQEDGLQVFRGLPFAAPPTGSLRFRPPVPPDSWTEPRLALQPGPAAPQFVYYDPTENSQDVVSEDCLALNVWTPSADSAARPVMVWIHGGANIEGSARNTWYDGTALATRGNVVVVTIQYRLGIFGFLELTDIGGKKFAGSGNAGLLDQIAALAWVRDNIAAFGGDPNNVTVFGESAGGGDIYYLLGASKAQGLFHKAIIQSGVCFPLASRASETKNTRGFMKQIGVRTTKQLQEMGWAELLALGEKYYWGGPHLDGAVLSEQTYKSILSGRGGNVPVMIGTNLDEIRYWTALCAAPGDRSVKPGPVYRAVFGNPKSLHPYFGRNVNRVIKTYNADFSTHEEAVLTFIGDGNFRIPSIWCAEDVGKRQPVFMYLLTYRSPVKGRTGLPYGSCHSMELPFVFGLDGSDVLAVTGSLDLRGNLEATTMDAWLGFARSGDPSTPSLAWPRYDTTTRATMMLGPTSSVVNDPYGAERKLWANVPRQRIPYPLPFAV